MLKTVVYIVNGDHTFSPIIRKDWLEVLNKEKFRDDWVINFENLSEDVINYINTHCRAVVIREAQYKDPVYNLVLDKITIPVFSQLEFPYLYLHLINKDRVYLTDASYIQYFPKAEIHKNLINQISAHYSISDKKFDVMFVGTFGLRNASEDIPIIKYAIRNDWMGEYMNDFQSTDQIFLKLRKKLLYRLFVIFHSKTKVKEVEWYLQHQIRKKRRDFIVDELYHLANLGYKIAFVTNSSGKKNLDQRYIDKFNMFYDLDFNKELPELARMSSIVMVSTPLHQSIINERFFLSIENGSLPLVEPYPQYQEIFQSFEDDMMFQYFPGDISSKINRLLNNRDKQILIYNEIKNRSSELFSKNKFIEYFESLILKYKKKI